MKNFTGIDPPYGLPEHPELWIDTSQVSLEAAADAVLTLLRERGGILDLVGAAILGPGQRLSGSWPWSDGKFRENFLKVLE